FGASRTFLGGVSYTVRRCKISKKQTLIDALFNQYQLQNLVINLLITDNKEGGLLPLPHPQVL
ncbi:unnamed protein product, partial [marine sediment metagenome]